MATIPLSLEQLPQRQRATVAGIAWDRLTAPEGVGIEVLHRARIGGGPIACRIGRMTVALRRRVAGAIHVDPLTS
jgi:ferrous iron transport protein A